MAAPELSAVKQRLFTAILIALPIVLLILLEASLRIVHYGGNLDLFVSGADGMKAYKLINPHVARRFFVTQKHVPTPSNDLFLKTKPENGYRIFVLGGSTAAGFPYGQNLMFSRILEARLRDVFPQRAIKVVNLSMSAINSYSLLDFMDEILENEPNAILVYAGHNEYYGALGVASMERFGRRRWFVASYLKLQRLRTFLLVRNMVTRLKRLLGGAGNAAPSATLMERMAAEKTIPLHSRLYEAGVQQFEGNLTSIVKKAKRAGVPVLLSELVCNVRDLEPFVSTEDSTSAERVFEQARQAEQKGEFARAHDLYYRAKDLDALRFRAPEALNDVIHRVASRFSVPFVPMKKVFEDASEHGLIGDDLMIDHLHPKAKGYFLMADAFFTAMRNNGFIAAAWPDSAMPSTMRANWGCTALDSVYADLSIRVLKGGWPFQKHSAPNRVLQSFKPSNIIEELALRAVKYDNVDIRDVHKTLAEYYEKIADYRNAYHEYQALIASRPFSAMPRLKAAEMLVRVQDFDLVPGIIKESLQFGEFPLSYILLGESYNALGHYQQAIDAFLRAKKLGADARDPHILAGLKTAYAATGQSEKADALPTPNVKGEATVINVPAAATAYLEKAQSLIQAQQYDRALQELEASLKATETGLAYMWMGQIYLQKKQPARAVALLQKAKKSMPDHPYLLYNLSLGYTQLGQYERAWDTLVHLNKIKPDFGDPYQLMEKLARILEK